jgi:sRNA-binding carbon storage regulator CsrA
MIFCYSLKNCQEDGNGILRRLIMLCISMKPSEYFTVGKETVVQFDRLSGDRVHLIISAPKEVPILRGDVLERRGGKRPDCVLELSPRYIRQLPWNHAKKQALHEMRELLAQMGDTPEALMLQKKLEVIFPVQPENAGDKAV